MFLRMKSISCSAHWMFSIYFENCENTDFYHLAKESSIKALMKLSQKDYRLWKVTKQANEIFKNRNCNN